MSTPKRGRRLRGSVLFSITSLLLLLPSSILFAEGANVCQSTNYTGPIKINYDEISLGRERTGYGIPVKVNTQDFVFGLNARQNETLIFDSGGENPGDCKREEYNQNQCFAGRGGYINRQLESWEPVTEQEAEFIGKTSMEINENITLTDVTILATKRRAGSVNALGLGPGSRLLQRLVDTGYISSRSYSWWLGQFSFIESERQDGNVVLGGLDRGMATDKSFTTGIGPNNPDDCDSGMVFNMMEITMDLANGTSIPISDFDGGQQFCIIPGSRTMQLPAEVFEAFNDIIDNPPDEDPRTGNIESNKGMIYSRDQAYTGGLTFKISDELTIKIENNHLVVPPLAWDERGNFLFNETAAEVLLSGPDPVRDTPRLGGPLLSAAFLAVNYDANTFAIHEINKEGTSNLLPIVNDGDTCESGNEVAPDDSDVASADSDSDSDSEPGTETGLASSKMSGGAIAGVAIGVVGGVAVIVALLFFFFRRRNAARGDGELMDKNNSGFDPNRSLSPQGMAGATGYYGDANGHLHRGPSAAHSGMGQNGPYSIPNYTTPTVGSEPTYRSGNDSSTAPVEMGTGRATPAPYSYDGAAQHINTAAALAMSQYSHRQGGNVHNGYYVDKPGAVHEMDTAPLHELYGQEIKSNGLAADKDHGYPVDKALPPPPVEAEHPAAPRYSDLVLPIQSHQSYRAESDDGITALPAPPTTALPPIPVRTPSQDRVSPLVATRQASRERMMNSTPTTPVTPGRKNTGSSRRTGGGSMRSHGGSVRSHGSRDDVGTFDPNSGTMYTAVSGNYVPSPVVDEQGRPQWPGR